jgi:hypothetical protein
MSLQDIDDLDGAASEIARVLVPGGHVCLAIVHPIASAGRFEERRADAPLIIRGSYLDARRYSDVVERDGLRMTFSSIHRPIEAFVAALAAGGLLIEGMAEVADGTDPPGDRWQRIPIFLHIRAVKPT